MSKLKASGSSEEEGSPRARSLWRYDEYGGTGGLTLIELALVVLMLLVAVAAILGAHVGQLTLNEHARNLSLAVQDADRVIEEIRRENAACAAATPSAVPDPDGAGGPIAPYVSWDAWLDDDTSGNGGNGKSIPVEPELIAVTCQNQSGTQYCDAGQFGSGEWHGAGAIIEDPFRITVAVCWRHRNRTIGECSWNGTTLIEHDSNADGVITSPAMLTTLVTCK